MNDDDIRRRLSRLHTALLADVLDSVGFRHSAFGPDIRPMSPAQKVVGRALTMRCESMQRPADEPYAALIAAFGDMRDGDVIVLACADRVSAMWGELLSTAAKVKGAVGAVMDGLARDPEQTLEVGFPVFSIGYSPLDSSGRQEVVAHATTVQCGTANVHHRDWIVGDVMGVIVIPDDLVERVVELAEAKDAGESTVRDEILAGEDLGEVFARHGIL